MAFFEDIVTLGDVPRFHARHRPAETALVLGDTSVDYRAWNRSCSRVARALLSDGLAPSDRIGFIGRNSIEYFEILFGAAKAGIVAVPINWRLAPAEISYIVEDADIEVLFVDDASRELARRAVERFGWEGRIILVPGDGAGGDSYTRWRDAQPDTEPEIEVAKESPVLQLYTSGTTGLPKGVQLSHEVFYALERARVRSDNPDDPVWEWNVWGPDDQSLINMPISHMSGTGWGIVGLYNGARNVVLPEFSVDGVLAALHSHRITKLLLVPTTIQMVLDHPDCETADFSGLRYLCYGASPIPIDLLKRAVERFRCRFVQMYGLTETTGAVAFLPAEDHDDDAGERMRSAGRAVAGVEIEIFDAEGAMVPRGQVGEICVRTPTVMCGYWKQPEETEKIIGRDGWLRTGDAGYMDRDGYVYVCDRVKDMIVSGGANIYPAEVEEALFSHPDVREVAVIGVPDAKWGEAVKALVVPAAGSAPTVESMLSAARELIAGYKLPKSIEFVESLPRTASGKLLKREIRKPYWKDQERQVN